MDKKNIIIISVIVIAIIIAAVLLFIVNPFSAEPTATVPNQTLRTPTPPAEQTRDQVKTEESEKPVEKTMPEPEMQRAAPESDTYVVKEGETLQSISERLYGDKTKWFKIFLANESTIDWYDTIYVGQKLKLPAAGNK